MKHFIIGIIVIIDISIGSRGSGNWCRIGNRTCVRRCSALVIVVDVGVNVVVTTGQ